MKQNILLNTQTSVEETETNNLNSNSSEDITSIRDIEGSVHLALKTGDVWRIAIGNELVSNRFFKTYEEAKKFVLKGNDWELLINSMLVVSKKYKEIEEQQIKKEENGNN